jgi:hypothetical protein
LGRVLASAGRISLCFLQYMERDASSEAVLTNADVADAFFSHLDALVVALDGADVSRATPPQMRRLVAVMDEVADALDSVVAAVDAANRAS